MVMDRADIERRAKAEYAEQQAGLAVEIQASMFDQAIDAPEIAAVLTRMQYLEKAVDEHAICQEALEVWAAALALETGVNRICINDQFVLKLTLKAAPKIPAVKVEVVAADLASAKAAYGAAGKDSNGTAP